MSSSAKGKKKVKAPVAAPAAPPPPPPSLDEIPILPLSIFDSAKVVACGVLVVEDSDEHLHYLTCASSFFFSSSPPPQN